MKRTRFAKTVASLTLCLAIGAGLLVSPSVDAAPSAQEVMEKAAETRMVDGSEAVVKMSIISEKGQVRERTLALATKIYDGGKTEKRVYRFTSPPDVNGTGVLVYDYDAKDDDIWVYLPALRKTRRIVSSQRSKSFMGSEFSYADVNAPTLSDFNYKFVKEEAAGGEPCWVVEVTPKDDKVAKDEGYAKKLYWVSKATYAIRKGEFYDLDGKLLKELNSKNIQLLDPKKKRYRTMYMEMVNKQNGRKSVFESEKAALSTNLQDDLFTTRYLERP